MPVGSEVLNYMSLVIAKANPDYVEAKQATEEIETPSIGFAAPSEFKEGTIKTLGALIKQNNTILYLLIKQGEEVKTIREELIKIKGRLKGLKKQEAAPQEFGEAIADLTKRLEKVGISDKTLPKSKRGPIYVNQDPNKIFTTKEDALENEDNLHGISQKKEQEISKQISQIFNHCLQSIQELSKPRNQ
ncbi:hypothetical protein Tco_0278914, partial [Tanacetum coccineum]